MAEERPAGPEPSGELSWAVSQAAHQARGRSTLAARARRAQLTRARAAQARPEQLSHEDSRRWLDSQEAKRPLDSAGSGAASSQDGPQPKRQRAEPAALAQGRPGAAGAQARRRLAGPPLGADARPWCRSRRPLQVLRDDPDLGLAQGPGQAEPAVQPVRCALRAHEEEGPVGGRHRGPAQARQPACTAAAPAVWGCAGGLAWGAACGHGSHPGSA